MAGTCVHDRCVIPRLSIDELADGQPVSPELAGDATPARPIVAVDLDAAAAASGDDLAAAALAVRRSLPMVIGIATKPFDPSADVLLEALDVTLATADAGCHRRHVVPVDDLAASLTSLGNAVGANPRAAITLGQVLRQTEQLDVRSGLAVEAAAYSMLLAGREFKSWLERRGAPRPTTDADVPTVSVQRDGDVLAVALDRPGRSNAFNAAMRDELVEALNVAIASPDLRVELTGRGENFSSGGDLDEFGTATEVDAAYLIRLDRHPGWLLHRLGERALVKVHGACIGAGVEMPSLAHRVIATADAHFVLPEVGMGVIPGAGGTVGIPRRIGRWRTAWLALTGARIDASTALDWALVDDVVRE